MNAVIANTVTDNREHIILLGRELEFASGIRALAAEQAMHEQGIDDPDALFDACDELVGVERLFESYDDSYNTNPTAFVLGQGCPFPSLEAYLALRELYGADWLVLATAEYAANFGDMSLRSDPRRHAERMVERARGEFAHARTLKFERFRDMDEAEFATSVEPAL